jgi:anti-sigma factor RsiW
MLCSDLSENDLHALVDGELAGERLDGVAARLATDRAAAERVAAYAEQRAALTALREELALVAPPAPALCDLEQALRDALGRQRRVRHSAAVVGAAVVGGSRRRGRGGGGGHDRLQGPARPRAPDAAAARGCVTMP